MRPATGVGQKPAIWLLFILSFRKCFKVRYLMTVFFLFIIFTHVHLLNHETSQSDRSIRSDKIDDQEKAAPFVQEEIQHSTEKCNFDKTELLLRYQSPNSIPDDNRPKPSIERLSKLFKILISFEEKFHSILDYLEIFRFNDLYRTLRPFANQSRILHEIYCHFQRYITVSDNGHIDITPNFIDYLKQMSLYLSDGFTSEHKEWNDEDLKKTILKPVIVLGANARFYDTLQASMKTVNQYWADHSVVIYDLGFDQNQLNMIKLNCERCVIITFPFDKFRADAPHVSNLPNFAWKPIIIQDAVRRFGSIIYGDTSVRYLTSDFHRLLVDNMKRGFSCRELPSHYLSCYTLIGTFSWFNETSTIFDDVYIAEAGFVAVTDNFLSRLVLKTWVTCALDPECISPSASRSVCSRHGGPAAIHRFDQSAMVVVLSFFFYQSTRKGEHTDPAPYDMFASIQRKIAEVRRFEGDPSYFTSRQRSQWVMDTSENKTTVAIAS